MKRLAGMTDADLLRRFVAERDEAAFAALLHRHSGMVLGVCRRVLRHAQDAEDACQATFLVLVRKAASIRKADSLASWLHGVAYRVSQRLKADATRQPRLDGHAAESAQGDVTATATWQEVMHVLDEELARLPATYRAPLVLCYLEGKTMDEGARRLGWTPGAFRGRLARGRALLRKRLTRRGISLPAVLFGVGLSSGTASSALPPTLTTTIVNVATGLAGGRAATSELISAKVTALTEGVVRTMFLTKLKLAAVAVCLSVVLAGLGASTRARPIQARAEDQKATTTAPRPAEPKPDGLAQGTGEIAVLETKDAVTVRARVLDPDGKPLASAKAAFGWWQPFGRDWFPWIVSPFVPHAGATSGPDGRFCLTLTKAEIFAAVDAPLEKPWRRFQVVASAPGYGPGFVTLEPGQKDLTIRLVRKNVPVQGRVLDLQGRPVAGATLRIDHLSEGAQWQRILFVNSWPGLPARITTDRDGRFTLKDVGAGRKVLLHLEGPTIEHKLVTITTPTMDKPAEAASVEIIAGPTKPIQGTIRDRETGQPLAGIAVYGNREAHRGGIRAVTDAAGRYELVGLPKSRVYELDVFPTPGQPYLEVSRKVADSEGLKPLQADFALRRGVPIRLRVLDKVTRQPVRGVVRYSPLSDNPLHAEARRPASNWASDILHMPDKDHAYNFVAFPGPGIIYAWVAEGRYLPAQFSLDPADEQKGYTLRGGKDPLALGWLSIFEGYRIIDPAPGDKAVQVEIELDPGRTVKGSLQGPDGKPVTGAVAYGLNYNPKYQNASAAYAPAHGDQVLQADTFTAEGLHPKAPRTISFVQKDGKLAGHVVLRGDEMETVAVHLQPWGILTGRLVDAAGKPLPGVKVQWRYPSLPAPSMRPTEPAPRTDAEGRFRLEGVLPGRAFGLALIRGSQKEFKLSADALKSLTLKPGEARDLGDVHVKVMRLKKEAGGTNDE